MARRTSASQDAAIPLFHDEDIDSQGLHRPTSTSPLLPTEHSAADARALPGDQNMEPSSPTSRRRSWGSQAAASSEDALMKGQKQVERKDSDPSMEMDDMRSEDGLEDDEETGLTEADRKKRTRRKEQNAGLDGQVSGAVSVKSVKTEGGASIGTMEEKLVTPTLMKNILVNALLICLWYSFSISISVYNKWMFGSDGKGKSLNFPFPLFTTSLHMVVQFTLASSVLFFMPRFRPGRDGSSNSNDPSYKRVNTSDDTNESTTPEVSKPAQPLMTKWFYLSRIGPCGTATALDIGLGNFSLRFISLTFFTMCKSSVLAFVLLFAFLFRLENPTWKLCLIILFMTVGVIMMVAGETAFDALGFVLVMLASFCSGFRWSLTQILLLRNRATSNPFSSIFFLTPVMFLALFILGMAIEQPADIIRGIKDLSKAEGGFVSFLLLLFPGVLAFLMVSAEFALLKRSSVVTLSVCGIFKEVLTISAAGAVFGDELSPINVSGLVVTILSIAAYNYLKLHKMQKEAVKETREIVVEERAAVLGESNKAAVAVDPDHIGDRRDSSSALMSNSLHLDTDVRPDDTGQDQHVNGSVDSMAKKPVYVE